jgi:hypothetical protein
MLVLTSIDKFPGYLKLKVIDLRFDCNIYKKCRTYGHIYFALCVVAVSNETLI